MSRIRSLINIVRTNAARMRAASISRRRAARHTGRNILVICYGNIYRSPFVGEYLQDRLAEYGYQVKSTGVYQVSGRSSNEDYVRTVSAYGVDLSAHRSTAMTCDLLEWADYVLVMDRHNFHAVIMMLPDAAQKILWLGSFDEAANDVEIVDPYGRPPDLQKVVIEKLIRCADRLGSILADKN